MRPVLRPAHFAHFEGRLRAEKGRRLGRKAHRAEVVRLSGRCASPVLCMVTDMRRRLCVQMPLMEWLRVQSGRRTGWRQGPIVDRLRHGARHSDKHPLGQLVRLGRRVRLQTVGRAGSRRRLTPLKVSVGAWARRAIGVAVQRRASREAGLREPPCVELAVGQGPLGRVP